MRDVSVSVQKEYPQEEGVFIQSIRVTLFIKFSHIFIILLYMSIFLVYVYVCMCIYVCDNYITTDT